MRPARRQGQPLDRRHIPFGPQVDVVRRRCGRAVPIIGTLHGIGQFAVDVHHPAQHTHPCRGFTEHGQLHPTIVALAIGAEDPGAGVGFIGRLTDSEGAGRERHVAQVILGTHFHLTAGERRENLVLVDRGGRCDLALAQAFHVVGIHRQLVRHLVQHTTGRRHLLIVIRRVAFDPVTPIVHLHSLPAQPQGQQQPVIKKAEGVGQRQPGETVLGVIFRIKSRRGSWRRRRRRMIEVAG